MATTASTYISKIDTTYPQAGKNNNTQGFRDNFRNIQLSLSNIDSEVENLQLTSVKNSGTLYYTNLKSYAIDYPPEQNVNTFQYSTEVNYRNGNYQKFNVTTSTVAFSVTGWASGKLSELTLAVMPTTTATVSFNGGTFRPVGSLTLPVTITTTTFFDLWTDNAGTTETYVARRGG